LPFYLFFLQICGILRFMLSVPAPAKLNLHLRIGNRRPDGFHDIESLFLALAFGDTLYFETTPVPLSLEIDMKWQTSPQAAIPLEKNIITKAVSLFRSRTGSDAGLKITVEKRIPLGGGLGGGSSDAAATLLALNRLFPRLDAAALVEIGAVLGSDVPFFLHGTEAAWVSGRGEHIQPLELPESVRSLSLVLVNPGFSSDTAAAFRLLDLWRASYTLSASPSPAMVRKAFSAPPHTWPFTNDFLPVFSDDTESIAPSGTGTVYQEVLSSLRESGADFAGLSGSGSTCFGVFSGNTQAESAREALLRRWPIVICTFCLHIEESHCIMRTSSKDR
jgi:4-diphosphocytidyl-2-C-methyl-D-erythritol kinase